LITLDRDRRLIELHVSAKELAARKKKWKAPKSRYKDGILAEYARHVSSASLGAVVEQRGPARTNITSPGWAKGAQRNRPRIDSR
jgi:dihydroxyacid dehydratase/phosphogluconate dehydratase